MAKWEYRYLKPGFSTGDRDEGMMESINELGDDGWRFAFLWEAYIVMEREKKDSFVPEGQDPDPTIPQFQQ